MLAGKASDELRFRSPVFNGISLFGVRPMSLKSWLPGFRQFSVWRVSAPLNISTAAAPAPGFKYRSYEGDDDEKTADEQAQTHQ